MYLRALREGRTCTCARFEEGNMYLRALRGGRTCTCAPFEKAVHVPARSEEGVQVDPSLAARHLEDHRAWGRDPPLGERFSGTGG